MELILKGNTEQNSVPAPDNPVDVKVVTGDVTVNIVGKNLFDKNNANLVNGYLGHSANDTIVSDTKSRVVWIKCEPNTTYTVSKVISGQFRLAYSIIYLDR